MATSSGSFHPGRLTAALRQGISILWCWEARLRGVEIQGRLLLQGRPLITRAPGSRLVLGPGVSINSARRANPFACSRPGTLRTIRPGAELILGPGSGLSSAAVVAARSIHIGEGTIIGVDALVMDNDLHAPEGEWGWGAEASDNPRPVVIGRGVFIGARAIILKGVTIGDRAVIGAGAVVSRDVPARHLAFGNPAQVKPIKA